MNTFSAIRARSTAKLPSGTRLLSTKALSIAVRKPRLSSVFTRK